MVDITFDVHSLEVIARLLGFEALLTGEVASALEKSAQSVEATAQANTWTAFTNPTGELADSIQAILNSPTQAKVTVGVPYGMRREYGFSGMTDSLGRHFTNDPGKPYMQPAADASHTSIEQFMTTAILTTIGIVGA